MKGESLYRETQPVPPRSSHSGNRTGWTPRVGREPGEQVPTETRWDREEREMILRGQHSRIEEEFTIRKWVRRRKWSWWSWKESL